MVNKLGLSCALMLVAECAVAQTRPQASAPDTAPVMTCGDFQRGATMPWWSSLVKITVNGRAMNMAEVANQQCRAARPETPLKTRFSQVLLKISDRWVVVEQHNSRVPIPRN